MDIWFKKQNEENSVSSEKEFEDSYRETVMCNADAIFPVSLTKPTYHSGVHYYSFFEESTPVYNIIPEASIVCRGFDKYVTELQNPDNIITTSFLILKHNLHADKDYVFYTMYTHLLPFTYYGFDVDKQIKSNVDEKTISKATLPKDLPFYLKMKVIVTRGLRNPSLGNKCFVGSKITIKDKDVLLSKTKIKNIYAESVNSKQQVLLGSNTQYSNLVYDSVKLRAGCDVYNKAGIKFAEVKSNNCLVNYVQDCGDKIKIAIKGSQLNNYFHKGIIYFDDNMKAQKQFRYINNNGKEDKSIIAAAPEDNAETMNKFFHHFYPLKILTQQSHYKTYYEYFNSNTIFYITKKQFESISKKSTLVINKKDVTKDKKEKLEKLSKDLYGLINNNSYSYVINVSKFLKDINLNNPKCNANNQYVCFYDSEALYSFEEGERMDIHYVILPKKKGNTKFVPLDINSLSKLYKFFSVINDEQPKVPDFSYMALLENLSNNQEIINLSDKQPNKIKIRILEKSETKNFNFYGMNDYDVGEFYVSSGISVNLYVDKKDVEEISATAILNDARTYESGLLLYDSNKMPVDIVYDGDSFYPRKEKQFFENYKAVKSGKKNQSEEEVLYKNSIYTVHLKKDLNLSFGFEEDKKADIASNAIIGHGFPSDVLSGWEDNYVDIALFTKKDLKEITYTKDYLPGNALAYEIEPKI